MVFFRNSPLSHRGGIITIILNDLIVAVQVLGGSWHQATRHREALGQGLSGQHLGGQTRSVPEPPKGRGHLEPGLWQRRPRAAAQSQATLPVYTV